MKKAEERNYTKQLLCGVDVANINSDNYSALVRILYNYKELLKSNVINNYEIYRLIAKALVKYNVYEKDMKDFFILLNEILSLSDKDKELLIHSLCKKPSVYENDNERKKQLHKKIGVIKKKSICD